jgi:hypothetical protein
MNLLDTASLVVTPNGYKASKLYSIIPTDGTGDMTFARTGDTATRVNSSGLIESVLANKPRLDYLGSTCPKLLLEPQRTNLLLQSNDFSGESLVNATIGVNVLASPDGTSNADSLIENSTAGGHAVYNFSATTFTAASYTFSVFLKKGGRDWARISIYDNGISAKDAWFNLNTGVIGTVESEATATMTNFGNGWYRCTITRTMSANGGGYAIYAATGDNVASYTGTNALSAIYLYGRQLEAGAYATSYIPTTTASVTRNADACSKTSISSLIGQTEGTIFVDISDVSSNDFPEITIDDNTNTNRIVLTRHVDTGAWGLFINANGSTTLYNSTVTSNFGKIAITYSSSGYTIHRNGVQILSFTHALPTVLSAFRFNGRSTSDFYTYKKIKSFAIWKTKLTNQELVTLTTV